MMIEIRPVYGSGFRGGRNWPGKSTKELFRLMDMFVSLVNVYASVKTN